MARSVSGVLIDPALDTLERSERKEKPFSRPYCRCALHTRRQLAEDCNQTS